MEGVNVFNGFSDQFITITVRAATATYLIIFNACCVGEPVRLLICQWEEALKGEWSDQRPGDEDKN